MKTIYTLGRILFALPFLASGISRIGFALMKSFDFIEKLSYIPFYQTNGSVFWAYFFGIPLITASVCLIVNRYTFYASIVIMGLLTTLFIIKWIPQLFDKSPSYYILSFMLTDIALFGCALIFAANSFPKPKADKPVIV